MAREITRIVKNSPQVNGLNREPDCNKVQKNFIQGGFILYSKLFLIYSVSFFLTMTPLVGLSKDDKKEIVQVLPQELTDERENEITVAMSNSPLSAPFIIASEKGYFKEQGLQVKIKKFNGGHRSIKALFSGEADVATSSEAVVMFNSYDRSDFGVFCTFVTSDNDVKIIARSDSGIKKISDLVGRKIGTIKGTSAHYFLSHTLLLNGISESSVEIISINPEDSVFKIESKEVDVIVTWEPYSYLAKKTLGDAVTIIPHGKYYIETFNGIVMREFAKNNQVVLELMLKALIKATHYMQVESLQSQKIVATRLHKDLNVIAATWNDFNYAITLNQWLLTGLESEARWAVEHGFVTKKKNINYLDYVLPEPLRNVSPVDVTIYR